MIFDNLSFTVSNPIRYILNDFLFRYGAELETLRKKQISEEQIIGFSDKPFIIIKYWAAFWCLVMIKTEMFSIKNYSFSYYNDKYHLSELDKSLQLYGIDIKEMYEIFEIFGY